MEVRPVDPRDIEIQFGAPAYRVYFWELRGPHEMAVSTEYEITDAAGVHEVIAWADETAGAERTYVLYARVGKSLIRLSGDDPTRADQ